MYVGREKEKKERGKAAVKPAPRARDCMQMNTESMLFGSTSSWGELEALAAAAAQESFRL